VGTNVGQGDTGDAVGCRLGFGVGLLDTGEEDGIFVVALGEGLPVGWLVVGKIVGTNVGQDDTGYAAGDVKIGCRLDFGGGFETGDAFSVEVGEDDVETDVGEGLFGTSG